MKSRIGPFALEAPLSSSRSKAQVFRGVHLKQSKLAAIRVFNIPMGMTPESRRDFATQLEQLKELRHPGIVRCFGGGYDASTAFLAYELVDGESLEVMLERRGRLPWETVFEYSQQLAGALKYAHERDWIHGRIKPDKIIIGQEIGAQLTDFRRDQVAALLDAKPTYAMMLHAAPERFVGQEPTAKSDLYSLGTLLYFMLTGEPPFNVPPEQLKERVTGSDAPDVTALAFDCPVWFSSIVNQLLARDPANRTFSATALLLAFKEAKKRQSEGVGVLQHAASGFSPLRMQTNRDEAEKVLGIKPKKKKKKRKEVDFLEQTWVLAFGLVLAIAAIVRLLFPDSEATLYARASAKLPPKTERPTQWSDARSELTEILDRFPNGEHAEWATEQLAWIRAREKRRELERQNRFNDRTKWTDADLQYWNAWEFEQFGDLPSAQKRYTAVISLYKDDEEAAAICFLSQEALDRLAETIAAEGELENKLQSYIDQKLEEANQAYDDARIVAAREIWESILELYQDDEELASQVQQATGRLEELKSR